MVLILSPIGHSRASAAPAAVPNAGTGWGVNRCAHLLARTPGNGNGYKGSFLAEKFETQDGYTGVSLTFQLGPVMEAGNAPLMATAFMRLANGGKTSNIALHPPDRPWTLYRYSFPRKPDHIPRDATVLLESKDAAVSR